MGVCFILVAVVTSISLLDGRVPVWCAAGSVDNAGLTIVGFAWLQHASFIGELFGTFEEMFINVFVFTSTGENYPDIVYVKLGRVWMVLQSHSRSSALFDRRPVTLLQVCQTFTCCTTL